MQTPGSHCASRLEVNLYYILVAQITYPRCRYVITRGFAVELLPLQRKTNK